ncbi:RNA-directed RNA polymerase [ssRNA phage SRR5466729_3]|uniref:RNA-directed RNA polymerase n=1 Tax=ssRNA phage SRR5466729_3 TaxID=2786446 RepID=A0A8S5KZP8_9VIRU|nr:RNA-directed RNA polymerase [ssRNA phage SRR5466729_3]DAD50865.1 TPA_asm: RNA-directed RNA polymerase [ssRNA phage SRR5466729_3]
MEKYTSWTQEWSVDDSLPFIAGLTSVLALRGGGVGQYLFELARLGRFSDLINYSFDYDISWDVNQLIACRQIQALYKKFPGLPGYTPESRERVAYETFVEAEAVCADTNRRFRTKKDIPDGFSPTSYSQLYAARKLIRTVLGPVPQVSDLRIGFGPGATTTVKKESACPQIKLADTPTCSTELAHSPWLPSFLRSIPHWLNEHSEDWSLDEDGCLYSHVDLTLSPSSLRTVPKDATKDRMIEIQPTLNTMLQKGIGKWIQSRLLLVVGLDIRDQSKNQSLARSGSINGHLMTLDLKSASATISRELVRFLLPEDWYQFLYFAGCSTAVYKDGEPRHLEMFCSMGNGYTFPLETLIFYALTRSACGSGVDGVTAYGDDIICPTDREDEVKTLLTHCGFLINENKCGYGPFRESCGADYYHGINIRPFYLTSMLSGETLYVMHNYFVRSGDLELAELALSGIATNLRLFGPDGYGDGVLIGNDEWPRLKNREQKRRGFGGVFFRMFRRVSCERISIYPGDYISPLYSIYSSAPSLQELLASDNIPEYETGNYHLQTFRKWKFRFVKNLSSESLRSAQRFAPDGLRPIWDLPGSNGYEEVLIYTLSS